MVLSKIYSLTREIASLHCPNRFPKYRYSDSNSKWPPAPVADDHPFATPLAVGNGRCVFGVPPRYDSDSKQAHWHVCVWRPSCKASQFASTAARGDRSPCEASRQYWLLEACQFSLCVGPYGEETERMQTGKLNAMQNGCKNRDGLWSKRKDVVFRQFATGLLTVSSCSNGCTPCVTSRMSKKWDSDPHLFNATFGK